MNPFSGGARILASPLCSLSQVLGRWEWQLPTLSPLLAAHCLKPPYCTVISKETCQYGQVLEQLSNFYQTINIFIYSLSQKQPWLLFGKTEQI